MKPVRLSALAAKEIRRIGEDIKRDKPQAAVAFVAQLLQRCESVANAPEGYGLKPQYGSAVRGVTVPPYVILYRIRATDILILSVRHGARKPVALK